jgi:hypothetical protein
MTVAQTTRELPPLVLSQEAIKDKYFPGDTIRFSVTNQSMAERGFVIDVVTTQDYQSPDAIFYRELFSAFFNDDTAFIRRVTALRATSKKDGSRYRTPELTPITYDLQPRSKRHFAFILKGTKRSDGIRLQIRVIPDLKEDESEVVIDSKPFSVFGNPF